MELAASPTNELTFDEMGELIRADELRYKLEELIEEHGLKRVLLTIANLQPEN